MPAAVIPRTGSPLSFFLAAPGAFGPPAAVLADNIDPFTHDFVDLFTGADPIDAQVLQAIVILRSSGASVFEFGLRIDDTKMLASLKVNIESAVAAALSTLVKNRDIEFRGTDFGEDDEGIDPSNQQANLVIRWVNLRAFDNVTRNLTVPLNSGRAG